MGLTIPPCGVPLRVGCCFQSFTLPAPKQLVNQPEEAVIVDLPDALRGPPGLGVAAARRRDRLGRGPLARPRGVPAGRTQAHAPGARPSWSSPTTAPGPADLCTI